MNIPKPNPVNPAKEIYKLSKFSFIILIIQFVFCFTNLCGQITVPIPDIFQDIKGTTVDIKANGNKLLIATTEEFVVIDNNNNLVFRQNVGKIKELKSIGADAFILTETDLWHFTGKESLSSMKDISKIINIKELDNQLFVGTENGLWRITGKNQTRYENLKGELNYVGAFGENIFVVLNNILWIINRDGTMSLIPNKFENIKSIMPFGEQLFINAENGKWLITSSLRLTPIADIYGQIGNTGVFQNKLFINADENSWIIDETGIAKGLEKIKGRVNFTKTIEEKLFVNANNELWIIDQNDQKIIKEIKSRVISIKKIDDRLIITTENDSWVIKINSPPLQVKEIKGQLIFADKLIDRFLIVTDKDLWTTDINFEDTQKIPNTENFRGNIEGIFLFNKRIFLKSTDPSFIPSIKNFYRVDTKVQIQSRLTADSFFGKVLAYLPISNLLPAERISAESNYIDENNEKVYENLNSEFRYALSNDKNKKPADTKFSSRENFGIDLKWSRNKISLWVKDKWGNSFEEEIFYLGVPGRVFLSILIICIYLGLLLICLILSPYISFCHKAIMNPYIRKYGSFGLIPAVISIFPQLRRYILRRYSVSLNTNDEFVKWKERFVLPDEEFSPENFGSKLNKERKLLITGQSGIGKTSFFKYLTSHYISDTKPSLPAKVFPIYISLTNYGGGEVEELVYRQLFAYGNITDEKLAPMFLNQGGLLIFLDGINEVQSLNDRQSLNGFVEKYWTSNFICLSAQDSYPEFDHIQRIELKTLTKQKVNEFIEKRTNDKDKAKRVIASLTGDGYQLYRIPRDLEFAIKGLNNGEESMPESRNDLYKSVFQVIFDDWIETGRSDAKNILCRQTYEMVEAGNLVFDIIDNTKFGQITLDIFEQGLLIKGEKNYYFRHVLIRDYLASEYFYDGWENLLEALEKKTIDSNWLELFKFTCEKLDKPEDIKNLVYKIMEKSIKKNLVKDLFDWLIKTHPNKCASWKDEFFGKYGEMDFKESK